MTNHDFTACLSFLDFELLSKDLLEAELGIQLENFGEGRDKGIDLRYAPLQRSGNPVSRRTSPGTSQKPSALIVQCKRYSKFSDLKSVLKNKELAKIVKLKPDRYILTTSVSLSPPQADELKTILSPFVQSTGDIYGRERLNSLLTKHPEVERRHLKLWVSSAGVLDSFINAGTHVVSSEEVERTIASAIVYVRNISFDEALTVLKQHRVCIIAGLPGIGKTMLARMLLLYFYEKGFDVVKIESDISEARAVAYHNKPRFYYYDDFLGQTGQADKLNKNEDQKLLDFMASIRDSKDSVFILTTREYILNQAKLHYEKLSREKFDHRTCIIDLTKYSRRIRAQILYNHLHFSDLPRTHLDSLVAERGYIKIVDHQNYNPRLIHYLTDLKWVGEISSSTYLALFLRNLDNPVKIWDHAFHRQLSNRARHLLFILTTMPVESRISDLEQAFTSFHNHQCSKFSIPHSGVDFKSALKELDGTFVATRKVQDCVLVFFQNPSIRDFMQYLLWDGELVPDVIESLVFFEQAQWFTDIIRDEQTRFSRKDHANHAPKVLDALKRLFDAKSCSFFVFDVHRSQRVYPRDANPAARLATVMRAVGDKGVGDDDAWIDAKVSELATKVKAGKLSARSFLRSIGDLESLGSLTSNAGKQLVLALKHSVLSTTDIDDFEILAKLTSLLPQNFTDSELEEVRDAFSDSADEYAESCFLTNPDDIREEASRISRIGDLLQVDTEEAQDMLTEYADETEREEESGWDDDDDQRTDELSDVCSDSELDSMFGTLEG